MIYRKEIILIILICVNILKPFPSQSSTKFAKFFGLCYGSKYSVDELKEMAKKLDLIVLDSYHYPIPPAILKNTKKELIVLAYTSAFDVINIEQFSDRKMSSQSKAFRMYHEWKEVNSHEDWFLHDKNGKRIRVYINKSGERFGLDIGNIMVQEFYGKRAADLISNGYDGIFLDNVWVNYPYSLDMLISFLSAQPNNMNKEKWRNDSIDFLKAIKTAIGDKILVFNQVRGYDLENSLRYLSVSDGAMDENWLSNGNFNFNDFKEGINIINTINKKDKFSVPVAIGEKETDGLTLFCSYLLAKDGDNAYFCYTKHYRFKGINWYPFYELDLGEPKGNYYFKNDLFIREFTNGLVMVNPNSTSKSIAVKEGYITRNGEQIKRLNLKAKSGDIFLRKGTNISVLNRKKMEFFSFDTPLDFTQKTKILEGKMRIFIDSEPKKAEKAFVSFSLFDADNPNEGKVFINGNGPLDLPWGKGGRFNWKEFAFDPIPVETSWLVKGDNEIKFLKAKNGTFKVNKISIILEYESINFPEIQVEEKDFSGLDADLDFIKSSGLVEKATAVSIDIAPEKVKNAFIILTLFDADNPNEGNFFINGHGPIPLPEGRGDDYNWKNYTFDPIPINKSWLKKGWNGIRFKKNPKGTFKVNSVIIKLIYAEENNLLK